MFVDEDGRARLDLVRLKPFPSGRSASTLLRPAVREFLDVVANLILRDLLHSEKGVGPG